MENFPLVGYRISEPIANIWNCTHPNAMRIGLDHRGRTRLAIRGSKSVYLVNNGTSDDFKVLRDGCGMAVADGDAFVVRLTTSENPAVRVEVHILEYDANRKRIGISRVPARSRSIYVPSATTANVLLTVRARGEGETAIDGLEVQKIAKPNGFPSDGSVHTFDPRDSDESRAGADIDQIVKQLREITSQIDGMTATLEATSPAAALARSGGVEGGLPHEAVESSQALNRTLLMELAKTIPDSNGSEYFKNKIPYHVAIITDEYMLNFYKDAFEQVTYVRPDSVDDVIGSGFDILLYVTCWKGLANEEWRGVKFRERPRSALDKLLEYCSAARKPTIFQTIEDPSNYDYFLPVAEKFDYVFTSDSDRIEHYKRDLGHGRVAYLEYGANPVINNPIGTYRHRLNMAFFAGSYPKRYQERVSDMHVVFDSILESGGELTIIDRNYGAEDLQFPEKYLPYSMRPVPHDILQKIHKLFRWSLNFNSIKASPTMCAMRVYELQAQGKGIISNYARSVFNKFPEIRIVAERENLFSYFDDSPSIAELKANEAQIRSILTACTAHDIAGRMLKVVGLEEDGRRGEPKVALVARRCDDALRAEVSAQCHADVELFSLDSPGLADRLRSGYDYVGFVDPMYSYGPNYVIDRINAFKYTDSTFVTQASSWTGHELVGPAHEFVTVSQADLTLYSLRKLSAEELHGLVETEGDGFQSHGYAIPPFEAHVRDADEMTNASSPRPEAESAEEGEALPAPVLSIIVPVYNAGRYLTTKCLPSIRRNQRADEFEILVVDDGSTDGVTPEICRELGAQDPQIRVHCFEPGGSGSASRPRNKGIEMARGEVIAFLDPDNEISDGGYDVLLDLLQEARRTDPAVGFVSGYQVKVAERTGMTGRHTSERLSVVGDLRQRFFDRGKFPVVSTQAAVIARSLFEDGSLRFVERAAGQDTLFGWELMLKSRTGAFTNAAHLIYYAEREGSVTNSIDVNYFDKKLIMEKAQVEALEKHGLLELYRQHHFDSFYQNWYLPKLDHVRPEDRPQAEQILKRIYEMYQSS